MRTCHVTCKLRLTCECATIPGPKQQEEEPKIHGMHACLHEITARLHAMDLGSDQRHAPTVTYDHTSTIPPHQAHVPGRAGKARLAQVVCKLACISCKHATHASTHRVARSCTTSTSTPEGLRAFAAAAAAFAAPIAARPAAGPLTSASTFLEATSASWTCGCSTGDAWGYGGRWCSG